MLSSENKKLENSKMIKTQKNWTIKSISGTSTRMKFWTLKLTTFMMGLPET